MAKKMKKQNAEDPSKTPSRMPEVDWDAALDELKASEGQFLFAKEGRNKIRLLWNYEVDDKAYIPVTTYWQGKPRTKYMLLAYTPDSSSDDGDNLAKVRGLVLPKTAVSALFSQGAEGYPLFDLDEGHGASILKTRSGRRTEYTVVMSKDPVPVPEDIREELMETSLKELAEAYDEFQKKRLEENGESGSEGDADNWD